jgi:chromate transporter
MSEVAPNEAASCSGQTSLRELAVLFGRLGATAFGGPAAHIALMREEVVRRRGWLSDEAFLDLLAAANLIPGPNSTELAIHIGWARRRFAGLVVAGLAFIVPALLICCAFGWAYRRFGALPEARFVSYGVRPVILAVVVQAIWGLAASAAKTRTLLALGLVVFALALAGVDELALLFAAGCVALLIARVRPGAAPRLGSWLLPAALPLTAAGLPSASGLFWSFLKIGSVLYGSGYVLLAFLQREFVERLGWLDQTQLLDAVAVGQVTPGPVFTTATFIGWILLGPAGALAATAGIFLPAFVFVALSGPFVPRLRRSPLTAAALDGLNVASLALMAAVSVELARSALVDWVTLALLLAAALLLLRLRLNATWLVIGGALLGWLAHAFGVAPR